MTNVVADTVRQAYTALRVDPRRVVRVVAAPSVLIVAAELLPTTNAVLAGFAGFMAFLAYVVLAVRVHRHILLPDAEKRTPATAMQYATFGAWIVTLSLIGVAFLLPTMSFGAASTYSLLLALVPSLYIGARVSLVLPDRALGHSTPIGDVWEWSAGNGWKLVAVLFLAPLLMNTLVILVTLGAPKEFRELLTTVASIPVLTFEVALLSCAYRSLRNLRNAA